VGSIAILCEDQSLFEGLPVFGDFLEAGPRKRTLAGWPSAETVGTIEPSK